MPEHDGDHASNPPHGVGIPNDSAGIVQTIEQARSEGHTHEIGGGEEGSGHERPAGMGALLAVLGVV
ncbi:hypothetical protein, partial [Gluconobacter oxydans]